MGNKNDENRKKAKVAFMKLYELDIGIYGLYGRSDRDMTL